MLRFCMWFLLNFLNCKIRIRLQFVRKFSKTHAKNSHKKAVETMKIIEKTEIISNFRLPTCDLLWEMSLLSVCIAERKSLHIRQVLLAITVQNVSIRSMWIGIFHEIGLLIAHDWWNQLVLITRKIKVIWYAINAKNAEKKSQILLLQMMTLFLLFENSIKIDNAYFFRNIFKIYSCLRYPYSRGKWVSG